MRVIFDIVHPADVLFFKRPIETLRSRGNDILILSRRKDIACELLDSFGFEHTPISSAGTGTIGLLRELVSRDLSVLGHIRRFRPSVMIGFGGVSISHAGALTRTKSISFYDSENATLQTRITWPFISALFVPSSYSGPTPEGRTTRLKGTKELSFLHPSAFSPDRQVAIDAGLDPDRDNYFLRLVAWRANHDIGKAGWTEDLLRQVVERLSANGKIHLSSEEPLPSDLKELAYAGPKNAVHHVLGHCRLLVGESATMASEAAVLGVPAIYSGRDFPGYVNELETAGLIQNIKDVNTAKIMSALDTVLGHPLSEFQRRRDTYVDGCPDWATAVVDAIDTYGRPERTAH